MLFGRVTQDEPDCASGLLGDEGTAAAAVVDPRLEVDVCLGLARYMGLHVERARAATRRRAGHPIARAG